MQKNAYYIYKYHDNTSGFLHIDEVATRDALVNICVTAGFPKGLLFGSVCIPISDRKMGIYSCPSHFKLPLRVSSIKLPMFGLPPFRVLDVWFIFRRNRPNRHRVVSYSIGNVVVLHRVYAMSGKAFPEGL